MFNKKISKYLSLVLVVLPVVWLTGCAGDINISENSPAQRRLYDVADYSTDSLNISSGNLIGNFQLTRDYIDSPELFIAKLEQLYNKHHDPAMIAVLADTALQIGYRLQDEPDVSSCYFLSAAVYSIYYLKKIDKCDRIYDEQRIRLIRIYNSAVTELFFYLKERGLERKAGFELVMPGSGRKIFFSNPDFDLPLPQKSAADFTPCAAYSTCNLTHDTRVFGLGVPLIATLHKASRDNMDIVLPGMPLPVTLVIDIDMQPLSGQGTAVMRYVYSRTCESIRLDARVFPLAADFSTPLAKAAAMPQKMNFLSRTLLVADAEEITGLYLFEPFDEKRIPIVFVHGLMSDIRTWGQMINTLLHDPDIRMKYQFMGFAYSSGNPIFLSGWNLRQALENLRNKLIQQKRSTAAFDRMVLVGHSMGGLLSRLQVSSCSGKKAAEILEIKNYNILANEFSKEELEHIRKALSFQPLPFVKRVIFIAVPHRGSEIARSWIGALGSSFITLPVNLLRMQVRWVDLLVNNGKYTRENIGGNTGIDNLRPDAPVLKLLNELEISGQVPYHSIIGNHDQASTPGGTDGIVPYWSSHLDNAVSELVVKSNHSVHRTPPAIQEVRQILLEHLNGKAD